MDHKFINDSRVWVHDLSIVENNKTDIEQIYRQYLCCASTNLEKGRLQTLNHSLNVGWKLSAKLVNTSLRVICTMHWFAIYLPDRCVHLLHFRDHMVRTGFLILLSSLLGVYHASNS